MATVYSNALRLAEMVAGEEENTWGDIARDNWLKMVLAVGGYKALTVASSDITLSTANGGDGSGEQAVNMVLDCSGNQSANIDIIAPNVAKLYIIKNATTQGDVETIGIKTSGGSALDIPNGETLLVWCDGADAFETINAQISGAVALATNALQLGAVVAANYAQKAVKNSWTKPQTVLANVRTLTGLEYEANADNDTNIIIRQAELSGNITMANPVGTPIDGQILTYTIEQHASSVVNVTWESKFIFTDDTNVDLTQTVNKVDKFTFQYDVGLTRWLAAGVALNFPRT